MAAINGFFGNIQGPFAADEEILTRIQENCVDQINYISKLGITFVGDTNFDIYGKKENQVFVRINDIEFQIGQTRMLELQDVEIRSIQFVEDTDDNVYIDYQYVKMEEGA